MAKPLIYWDSCIFIAWLKDEGQPPEIIDGIQEIATAVDAGDIILVTSVLTNTEVLQCTLPAHALTQLDALFKRRNVQQVDVTKRISLLAHDIRSYYETRRGPKVWGADATHLATAIQYNCEAFHTLDGNRRDKKQKSRLLALDGNVAGYPLRVCVSTGLTADPAIPTSRSIIR